MISGLDFVGIPSTDAERSRRFYMDTLGLRPDENSEYEFWVGETCFAIWEPESQGMPFAQSKNAHPALRVDDIEAALPQVSIVTENEFTNGPVAYKGPLVRDVIDHLALGDVEALRFIAANDYYVEIPTSDFRRYNVILAMEADGQALSRREKGPLWLMYPISDHEELKDPLYIHRLIWQVVRIESP